MPKKKKQNTDKDFSVNLQKENDLFPSNSKEQKALKKVYALLIKTSQVDFSQYRDKTVLRRLNRRMNLCDQDNYTDYLTFLEKNPTETEKLFYDLLLSYTQFFRDDYIFDTLTEYVFPRLVKNHSARKPVRIWIPGCSSGEEVYSIAICLYEFMEDNKIKIPVQIFGTDLVEQHIIKARSGLYNDKIRQEVSTERLERFFDITPEGLKVIKHIRDMCIFATQDIAQDPPFPRIDLISCRNVLIYFDPAYQDAAIPRFHFSLNPDGFLLLGSSETMGRFPELFNVVDLKSNLYSKRSTAVKPAYHFPVTQKKLKLKVPAESAPGASEGRSGISTESSQINKILLDAYAPPGVLVDSNLFVRRFIGNTYPYLSPVSGEASLKLSRMAGNALMPDIYTAIQSAKEKNNKIRKKNIVFQNDGQEIYLDICVIPVEAWNINDPGFLILFEKAEALPAYSLLKSEKGENRSEIDRLKQELQKTKEHLQSIIEEKDEVNQELWAANEEIMSTNEELQSVNEEMEASKEELESGNEELLALNEELQIKNLAIVETEEKQRWLLQNIHAAVVIHAPDTSILMANHLACDILGLTIDHMIGKKIQDLAWCFFREDGSFMPPEEYPVNQVIATRNPVKSLSFGIKRPQTNELAWVLVHAFPKMGTDGTLQQVIVTFVDITDRINVEEALKSSEEMFRKLFNSTKDTILVMGIEEDGNPTNFTLVNDAACINLGYTREELLQLSPNEIDVVGPTGHVPSFGERLLKDKHVLFESEHVAKGGHTSPVEISLNLLQLGGKWVNIAIVRDISERKAVEAEHEKLQAQLNQAQKLEAVGRLAGGVAHDFNNMLGVILGQSEITLEEMNPDQPFYANLEEIKSAAQRSADLTRQLLAFARKQTIAPKVLDINETIGSMTSMLRRIIGENIDLAWLPGEKLWQVLIDPAQVDQILANLCVNARDAIAGMGKITIETDRVVLDEIYCSDHAGFEPGEYVMLAVSDNGSGMDTEILGSIFEPFFTTKEKNQGTGLGLATIYGIIKQNNGFINVYSELGQGTTFKIYLPRHRAKAMKTEERKPRVAASGSETILLVEDEPAILRMTMMMLEREGYSVIGVSTPGEAIRLAHEHAGKIDLLLSDVIMPEMNGHDLAREILSLYPGIRNLFMSGYTADVIAHHGVLDEGVNFIQKPFSIVNMTTKVREILDQKQQDNH